MKKIMWTTGVVALVFVGLIIVAARAQQSGEVVSQPEHWIAVTYSRQFFQGDLPSGAKTVFARSSDGSLRVVEPAPPIPGRSGLDSVMIENRAQARMFRRVGPNRWTSSPLAEQIFGGQPRAVLSKTTARQLNGTDVRISALAQAYPHLTFWEFTNSRGNRVVFCPELNLLDVHGEIGSGVTTRVVDVVLAEPSADLFRPPQGDAIEERSQPDGISQMTNRPPRR